MNPDRQNSNILFVLCLITGLLTLFYLPINKIDTFPFPNQIKVLPEKSLVSYTESAQYKIPDYLVCSIDDDPEDYTNHGIYHPVELAVTLRNLKRLGIEHLFLGTHLHWPKLDEKDNGALNTAITEFESCIISVPLRRAASPAQLPDFLQQTSISESQVKGQIELLPQVNNVSLAPTFIIPENTLTGFSQLETEAISNKIPLLAHWADRVVLSSVLLERMHHLKIDASELKVQLGQHIELGDTGNIIPIDEFGYFTPASYPSEAKPDIASSYITALKSSPIKTTNAILTAAGMQADNYRAINKPVTQLAQLTLTPVVSGNKVHRQLHIVIHIVCLFAAAYLLGFTYPLAPKGYLTWVSLLCLFWIGVALVLARYSDFYLVTRHLAIAILTGCICYFILKQKSTNAAADVPPIHTDFDDITNAFVKKRRIATSEAKEASRQRKRERKKRMREKRAQGKQRRTKTENLNSTETTEETSSQSDN